VRFEYQAIDENGGVVRGIIEASSPEKVLQILLHKQLHPLDIRPLTETIVELSRLNSLKRRLEGKKEMKPEPTPEEQERFNPIKEPKGAQGSIDWTYIAFLVLVIGLLVIAGFLG
jgi:hypothetical protein